MECPSLWQSTTFFQSNLSLSFALNSTGNNDREAKVPKSKMEDHDHVLVDEVSSWRVCPACTAKTDGTATPRVKNRHSISLKFLVNLLFFLSLTYLS